MAGAILLRISYGYEVKDEQDPLVDLAERGAYIIVAGAAPAFLVNVILIRRFILARGVFCSWVISVKYISAWFPGGGLKVMAREWKGVLQETADRPFQQSRNNWSVLIFVLHFFFLLMMEPRHLELSRNLSHLICWTAAPYQMNMRQLLSGLLLPSTLVSCFLASSWCMCLITVATGGVDTVSVLFITEFGG
jgi:hypothetical protein